MPSPTLPLVTRPIDRPTVDVPLVSSLDNDPQGDAGLASSIPVIHCGFCAPRRAEESWSARPPTTVQEEETWVTLLETAVHQSCLVQAQAEKLVLSVPMVVREAEEDAREFATRCLEPPHVRPALTCVSDPERFLKHPPNLLEKHASMEIPLMANHPFAVGFRLFPEIAPPRTLEDLLQCTAKLNRGGRLSESSLPLDVRTLFPELFDELRRTVPEFTSPGGPADVLWRDRRNIPRGSSMRMTILSPGSVLRAQRSRYRSVSLLMTASSSSNDCAIEWAGMSSDDAEKVWKVAEPMRSKEDRSWIPDLAFCVRAGARMYIGTQTQFGSLMLTTPGSVYWGFVRGSCSTSIVQWAFAERSREAFEFAMQRSSSAAAQSMDDELEIDLLDCREDFLHLRLFQEILKDDRERLQLCPKDLADALCVRLLESCRPLSSAMMIPAEQQQQGEEEESSSSSSPTDDQEERKTRCDECRRELFDRKVYCRGCKEEGHDPSSLIVLQASHPPRPSSKKDRSTLPDWLRVGCRVLVNLTVSGNSNDRPPRVVGAAHLPGIILKTGHGFFTVYLEGCGETVVKRKAAIEPHPSGPDLARGFRVNVRPDGVGMHSEPQRMQNMNSIACVFCPQCYPRVHERRPHNPQQAVFIDRRRNGPLPERLAQWRAEILARSGVRKDDLCPWGIDSDEILTKQEVDAAYDEFRQAFRPAISVSAEAGADALHAAQVMGPSPYHLPPPAAFPNGPVSTSSSSTALHMTTIASMTRHQTALASSSSSAAALGIANGAIGDSERRSRSHRAASLSGLSNLGTTGTSSTKRRGASMSETHQGDASSSSLSTWPGVAAASASLTSATRQQQDSHNQRKRSRSSSAHLQPHHTEDVQEEEERVPVPFGEPGETTSARELSLALQSGSFFVGGPQTLSMPSSSTTGRPVLEENDMSKPEAVRAIWAKARRDVPLKKMWKFFIAPPLSASSSTSSSSSKPKGVETLAASSSSSKMRTAGEAAVEDSLIAVSPIAGNDDAARLGA